MASLLSPRRSRQLRTDPSSHGGGALRLKVTRAVEKSPPTEPGQPSVLPVGWPWAAVVGGLATAGITWILWAGLAVLGWLSAAPGTLAGAVGAGTRCWLLANGVSARIGSVPVTLVPWASVAVTAFVLGRFSALTARFVRPGQATGGGVISLVLVSSYLVPVLAVAVWAGEPWLALGHWVAVIGVLSVSTAWSASRSLGRSCLARWPVWARALPAAAVGSQLVMLAAGAALVTTALLLDTARVTGLHAGLQPGVVGGIVLLVGQFAFAPNLVIWAGSYALGAGFGVGAGSVVAPAGSQLGLLPGVPVLGALPAAGPGGVLQLWWLAAGVLAGVVAAWLMVRARPGGRWDQTSLLGGLAGLLAGLAFAGLGWAAGGDLGSIRLVDLGPRLGPLLIMATTTMGLAGVTTGLLLGLVRPRPT